MKECPSCHAEAADTAKFCMKCGFNFKKYEEENTEIFCPECGTKFKGGDFCPECGTNVKAGAANAGLANGFGISPSAPAAAPAEDVFADDNWLSGLADVTANAVSDKRKAEDLADFTYETHSNGSVTVTGLTDKHAIEVILPDFVVAIADGAFENSGLMYVWTQHCDKLLRIGKRAFAGCTDLVSFTFPPSLTAIGDEAFLNCEALQESYPDHVKRVGKDAFRGSGVENWWQDDEDEPEDEPTSASAGVTLSAADATLFEIENGVLTKYKGNKAEVTVPAGVTEIGENAFRDCQFITKVTLPEGLQRLGDYAFGGCTALADITLPESVTELGYCAFYHCDALKGLHLPEGIKKLHSTFSFCNSLASITVPASVTELADSAFSYCTSLKSVAFAKGSRLTCIGSGAFNHCHTLAAVTLPATVSTIDSLAFGFCNKLKSVTLENPVGWCGTLSESVKATRQRLGFPPLPPLGSVDFGNAVSSAKTLTDPYTSLYTFVRKNGKK